MSWFSLSRNVQESFTWQLYKSWKQNGRNWISNKKVVSFTYKPQIPVIQRFQVSSYIHIDRQYCWQTHIFGLYISRYIFDISFPKAHCPQLLTLLRYSCTTLSHTIIHENVCNARLCLYVITCSSTYAHMNMEKGKNNKVET